MENCKVLNNGASLFVNTMPEAKKVYLDIFFRCGSAYEKPEENGISHFLEHMIFELDSKFRSSEIETNFKKLFASKNASTGDLSLSFRSSVIRKNFEEVFDYVCHYIEHPDFSENEKNLNALEKQRQIILAEKERADVGQKKRMQSKRREHIFKGTAFEKNVIGTEETIKNITLEKLKKHYEKFFIPENMFIIITGNITLEEAEKLVYKCFDSRLSKRSDEKILAEFNNIIEETSKIFKIKNDAMICIDEDKNFKEGSVVSLNFLGVDYFNKDCVGLKLLNLVLSGLGLSSRLTKRIREEEKLAYSVSSSRFSELENCFFKITSTINTKNIEKLLNCVADVFAEILKNGVSEEEFTQIVEGQKNGLECESDFETIQGRHSEFVGRVARSEFKYILDRDELLHRFFKAKREDIIEALKVVLQSNPMLLIYGQKPEKEIDLNKLKNMFKLESLMQRDYSSGKVDSLYKNNLEEEYTNIQQQNPKIELVNTIKNNINLVKDKTNNSEIQNKFTKELENSRADNTSKELSAI